MKDIFISGKLENTPHRADKATLPKLVAPSNPCRYLFPHDESHIVVLNIPTGKTERGRVADFIRYNRQRDPATTTSAAFQTFTIHPTLKTIETSTRPPRTHAQATRYPDAVHCAKADCGISIRVLRLLRILTDLNELRINVGHVWALKHCVTTGILAATDYTFTTPD